MSMQEHKELSGCLLTKMLFNELLTHFFVFLFEEHRMNLCHADIQYRCRHRYSRINSLDIMHL